MYANAVGAIADGLELLLFFVGLYYLLISIFALMPAREKTAESKVNRFAVVIPAHNEAHVLPGILQSLEEQKYPPEAFHVFVAADRCRDHTEAVARCMGAHVIPCNNGDAARKGEVLRQAFACLEELEIPYDCVVVLDADNYVDPRFLAEMNESINRGWSAVQGYIDSGNPRASWVSHAYSMWYWLTNRSMQIGRARLGLGCRLGGTGFVLTRELLERVIWIGETLAEDAEYTMKLALAGVKVGYCEKAVVYDEKPTSFWASVWQRTRWMQGITEVQRDYMVPLLKNGKLNALMGFWGDLLAPMCFLVCVVLDCFAVLSLADVVWVVFVNLWVQPLNFVLLNLYVLGSVFTAGCGLMRDRKFNSAILLNLLGFAIYILSWIPAGIVGVFRHNRKDWYHTPHKGGM